MGVKAFLAISLDGVGRSEVTFFIVFSGVVRWCGQTGAAPACDAGFHFLLFLSRGTESWRSPCRKNDGSVFWSRPFPQIGQRRTSWPVRRSILSGRDSFWGVGGEGAGSAERMSARVFCLEAEDSHP